MSLPYDSRFAQNLKARISEHLQNTHRDLGSGTLLIREDAAASGMNCAEYIGKIKGLKIALNCMDEIDREMNGKVKGKD